MATERIRISPEKIKAVNASTKVVFDSDYNYIKTATGAGNFSLIKQGIFHRAILWPNQTSTPVGVHLLKYELGSQSTVQYIQLPNYYGTIYITSMAETPYGGPTQVFYYHVNLYLDNVYQKSIPYVIWVNYGEVWRRAPNDGINTLNFSPNQILSISRPYGTSTVQEPPTLFQTTGTWGPLVITAVPSALSSTLQLQVA